MAATYSQPASEAPRLAIWDVMTRAMSKLVQMRPVLHPTLAVRVILTAFSSLGYVIEGGMSDKIVVKRWGLLVDEVVDVWGFLRDAYRLMAPELVEPTEAYARTAYRMVYGEDETFDEFGGAPL